jgi:hypothetical protein
MSDSTHTPGPWRIGDAGKTVFGPKTDQPAPITIATLQGATPRCGIAERAANKYLIAAAPDLLAALEAVMGGPSCEPIPSSARVLALAAFAKAKGEAA